MAGRIRMIELPHARVERVHAVVAVAVGREVGAAIAPDASPVEAVELEVARGHVLDDDPVGPEHRDTVLQLEVPVEDHGVPVLATKREVRRGHAHGLAVHTRGDAHDVSGDRAVDGRLDAGRVGRDADRPASCRALGRRRRERPRVATEAALVAAVVVVDVDANDDHADHAHTGRPMERAVEGEDALLWEALRVALARLQDRRGPRRVVREDVVRIPPSIHPRHRSAWIDPHERWREGVVAHLDRRRAVRSHDHRRRQQQDQHGREDAPHTQERYAPPRMNFARSARALRRSASRRMGVQPSSRPNVPSA